MTAWITVILILAVFLVMLAGSGCEERYPLRGDCGISCVVVDAGTRAPIDSAQVFVTAVGLAPSHIGDRTFEGLTDENGRLLIWPVSCDGFHIVDVEKEGYIRARQIVDGGGDLEFALEKVAPVSIASEGY